MAIGSAFKQLGQRARKLPLPGGKPRGVKLDVPKSPNYERIKSEVMEAIAQLPRDKQAQIPLAGTLPEVMVALALVQLSLPFQWQKSESGGRLRVGGSIVDFIVFTGGTRTIVRVNGTYWHSLPDRRRSDLVQAERLRAKRYRVWDAWEHELYLAWTEGRLKGFVRDGVMNAA